MADTSNTQKHFVLVHGGSHGAWCWYKLKPLLQNAGHRVTALDMAASGINLKRMDELDSVLDYSEPLIQFIGLLTDDQKVILVGHSLGGLNLAVTMEIFPYKVELAVFLTALMPDTQHTPSFIIDKLGAETAGTDFWVGAELNCSGDPTQTITTLTMDRTFMSKLYTLSPVEDLELAMMLNRPTSLFMHDVSKPEAKLSKDKYGSVRRVFVVCEQDQALKQAFQRWMAENDSVETRSLKGADHMAMLSAPQELCDCLLGLARI